MDDGVHHPALAHVHLRYIIELRCMQAYEGFEKMHPKYLYNAML